MITFHRFLIATAIVFCLGVAVWLLAAFQSTGGMLSLALGISFGMAALALSYYLKNLARFLRR